MNRLKVNAGPSSLELIAVDAVEKENRFKSGITTTVIAIAVALLLWLYNINLEVPVPLPEAHEVEVAIEPEMAGGGGGGSPNDAATVIPDQTSSEPARSVEETPDEKAVEQHKTPETPVEKPVDNSIEKMREQRKKAKEEEERKKKEGGGGKGDGDGSGDGDGKGPGKGNGTGGGIGDGTGPGIGHDIGGRSLRQGRTETDCHEAGKVVLEVMVLSNGKIIFQDVDPATTGSACLIRAAKEILRNSSFNEAANKPSTTGLITFNFRLN